MLLFVNNVQRTPASSLASFAKELARTIRREASDVAAMWPVHHGFTDGNIRRELAEACENIRELRRKRRRSSSAAQAAPSRTSRPTTSAPLPTPVQLDNAVAPPPPPPRNDDTSSDEDDINLPCSYTKFQKKE